MLTQVFKECDTDDWESKSSGEEKIITQMLSLQNFS